MPPLNYLNKTNLVPFGAGLLGTMLVFFATSRYGSGISADSVTYLAAAEHFGAGRGIRGFEGQPLLVFPPLFPILVAALSAFGLSPVTAARCINAISFGLIAFLSAHWLNTRTHSTRATIVGAVAILLSAPLIEISVYAWSEPLFCVFVLLTLWQFKQPPDSTLKVPVLAGVCAALACLTRYAGITLIITGVVLLLLRRPAAVAQTFKQVTTFLIIAISPLALWLLRNYALSSTLTGDRVPSKVTVPHVLYQAFDVVSLWFLPQVVPGRLRVALIVLFMLAAAMVLVFGVLKYHLPERWDTLWNLFPLLLFIGIYTSFMIITTATTALSPIDNRYMSPIFSPVVVVMVYVAIKGGRVFSRGGVSKLLPAAVAVGVAAWMIYPAITTSKLVNSYLQNGAGGFHSSSWMSSGLVDYLKTNTLPGEVYSNEPYAVYVLTGAVFNESPRKFKYESHTPTEDLANFSQHIQNDGFVYLVWFNTTWWEDYLYSARDLSTSYKLEPVVARPDGAVYRVLLEGETSDTLHFR